MSVLQFYYQVQAFEIGQEVMDYIGAQDFSEQALAESIVTRTNFLGEDPLMIYRGLQQIKIIMYKLVISSVIVYLTLGSLSWALTDQLKHKKNKNKFWRFIGKLCIIALGFIALILLLMYSSINVVISKMLTESQSIANYFYLVLTVILIYFMFISFSLIHKVKFKKLVKKTFEVGLTGAFMIVPAYMINIVVIGLLVWLTHWLSQKNLFLLAISMLLLLFSFVWSRIFLFLVVTKVND